MGRQVTNKSKGRSFTKSKVNDKKAVNLSQINHTQNTTINEIDEIDIFVELKMKDPTQKKNKLISYLENYLTEYQKGEREDISSIQKSFLFLTLNSLGLTEVSIELGQVRNIEDINLEETIQTVIYDRQDVFIWDFNTAYPLEGKTSKPEFTTFISNFKKFWDLLFKSTEILHPEYQILKNLSKSIKTLSQCQIKTIREGVLSMIKIFVVIARNAILSKLELIKNETDKEERKNQKLIMASYEEFIDELAEEAILPRTKDSVSSVRISAIKIFNYLIKEFPQKYVTEDFIQDMLLTLVDPLQEIRILTFNEISNLIESLNKEYETEKQYLQIVIKQLLQHKNKLLILRCILQQNNSELSVAAMGLLKNVYDSKLSPKKVSKNEKNIIFMNLLNKNPEQIKIALEIFFILKFRDSDTLSENFENSEFTYIGNSQQSKIIQIKLLKTIYQVYPQIIQDNKQNSLAILRLAQQFFQKTSAAYDFEQYKSLFLETNIVYNEKTLNKTPDFNILILKFISCIASISQSIYNDSPNSIFVNTKRKPKYTKIYEKFYSTICSPDISIQIMQNFQNTDNNNQEHTQLFLSEYLNLYQYALKVEFNDISQTNAFDMITEVLETLILQTTSFKVINKLSTILTYWNEEGNITQPSFKSKFSEMMESITSKSESSIAEIKNEMQSKYEQDSFLSIKEILQEYDNQLYLALNKYKLIAQSSQDTNSTDRAQLLEHIYSIQQLYIEGTQDYDSNLYYIIQDIHYYKVINQLKIALRSQDNQQFEIFSKTVEAYFKYIQKIEEIQSKSNNFPQQYLHYIFKNAISVLGAFMNDQIQYKKQADQNVKLITDDQFKIFNDNLIKLFNFIKNQSQNEENEEEIKNQNIKFLHLLQSVENICQNSQSFTQTLIVRNIIKSVIQNFLLSDKTQVEFQKKFEEQLKQIFKILKKRECENQNVETQTLVFWDLVYNLYKDIIEDEDTLMSQTLEKLTKLVQRVYFMERQSQYTLEERHILQNNFLIFIITTVKSTFNFQTDEDDGTFIVQNFTIFKYLQQLMENVKKIKDYLGSKNIRLIFVLTDKEMEENISFRKEQEMRELEDAEGYNKLKNFVTYLKKLSGLKKQTQEDLQNNNGDESEGDLGNKETKKQNYREDDQNEENEDNSVENQENDNDSDDEFDKKVEQLNLQDESEIQDKKQTKANQNNQKGKKTRKTRQNTTDSDSENEQFQQNIQDFKKLEIKQKKGGKKLKK